MRKTGTYQTFGDLDYFIPNPLSPTDPPLEISAENLIGNYVEVNL